MTVPSRHDPALDAQWMPFTANKAFKARPRLLVSAKDMHYQSDDGRAILDGTAGLWCVNAGHCRPSIIEAISRTAASLDDFNEATSHLRGAVGDLKEEVSRFTT